MRIVDYCQHFYFRPNPAGTYAFANWGGPSYNNNSLGCEGNDDGNGKAKARASPNSFVFFCAFRRAPSLVSWSRPTKGRCSFVIGSAGAGGRCGERGGDAQHAHARPKSARVFVHGAALARCARLHKQFSLIELCKWPNTFPTSTIQHEPPVLTQGLFQLPRLVKTVRVQLQPIPKERLFYGSKLLVSSSTRNL